MSELYSRPREASSTYWYNLKDSKQGVAWSNLPFRKNILSWWIRVV